MLFEGSFQESLKSVSRKFQGYLAKACKCLNISKGEVGCDRFHFKKTHHHSRVYILNLGKCSFKILILYRQGQKWKTCMLHESK